MNAYLTLTKYKASQKKSDLLKQIDNPDGKSAFFEKAILDFKNYWGTKNVSWYKQRYAAYEDHIKSSSDTNTSFFLKSSFPLIIGQGNPSILETHLTLHPIYGIPYLPGSLIKGVTAHYCHQVLGKEDSKFKQGEEYALVLFGSQEQAGAIHYHDALPTPKSIQNCLSLDVITPHHQSYNQGLNQAPRDDDSPVPVPFLAVKADFRVVLSCEGPVYAEWLNIAQKIVSHAVTEMGIGGKTNAGYGRVEV
ncbi:type III-B CRISPR module RAMP protein Cmr6 [Amphibacillus cookii]|uniref:type III-B CRISPR module RAMP protein Cmr6 n=1 Tax=Amphibacillus cookii TaxID=767787 RepID=UPI00195C52AD|nr:type III-B CRISPR module RAMP protein Cmr6 [Amphibacillus cookii]MBM7541840.1 CRISPR-associated protein Cmr6 [Amphibacillus cookii]